MEKLQGWSSDSEVQGKMENDPKPNCNDQAKEIYHERETYQSRVDSEVNAGAGRNYGSQQPRAKQTEAEEGSHVAFSGGKALQFTPEMIRDQELLITTMSQQNMSEAIIRRQFERLLEEQSKQLLTRSDTKRPESSDKRRKPEVQRQAAGYLPAAKTHNSCCPAEACNAQLNFSPVNPFQHQHQNYKTYQKQMNSQQAQQPNQYQNPPQPQQQNQRQHQTKTQMQNQCQNQENSQQQQQQPYQYQNHCDQQQQQYENNYQQQQHHPQQQYQNNCQQQQHPQQQQQQPAEEKSPVASKNCPLKVEPVSLLKLRMNKVTKNRNNGLQDTETAHDIIKSYKSKNKPTPAQEEFSVRLDGIQNTSDMEPILKMMHTPRDDSNQSRNRVLSNGLERDPNQPTPIRRSFVRHPNVDEIPPVYPRQRVQERPRYSESHHAGGDHQQLQQSYQEPPHSQTQLAQPSSSENPDARQQQQQQQGNQNCWRFCPEIQEPRIIGGVTYLARKPQCIPNAQGFLCGGGDNYANVDHSKSTAAF